MSRIVAVFEPTYRHGEWRVHLLHGQRPDRRGWWRTLCGRDTDDPGNSSGRFRRVRVENARGAWCRTCLAVSGTLRPNPQ